MTHYSPSQIGMFERCPRQWSYRYIEGLRLPPAGAMVMGTANHKSQEQHFRAVLAGEDGLALDAYTAATADHYDRLSGDVDWSKEDDDRGKVKDVAVEIARQYRTGRVDFLGAPVAVERQIDLAVPGADWTLRMILDLATRDGSIHAITVRDLKTKRKAVNGASKGKPEVDAAHATQLLLYSHAWESETGARPQAVVEYAWPKGVAPVPVPFSAAEVRLVLEEIDLMHRQIRAGLFPRKRNGWHCSERACGYWSRCIGSVLTDR